VNLEFPERQALAPGTPVEVLNRFTPAWSRGFEVVGAGEEGYVLRRVSDARVLPAEFRPAEVRPVF
jgi:hypothetical protein